MLFAIDLDGTLLTRNSEISTGNLRMLGKAHDAGAVIAIATGRGLSTIPKRLLNLPYISWIISANGAVISEKASRVPFFEKAISPGAAQWVLDICHQSGTGLRLLVPDAEMCDVRSLLWLISTIRKGNNAPPLLRTVLYLLKMFSLKTNIRRIVEKSNKPVYKIECVYKSEVTCREHQLLFSKGAELEVASTSGNDLEITAKGIDKGSGISRLAEKLDIPKEQIVAIGDSGNDISMRRAAGTLVAMGNAEDNLKALADHIAPSCEDDGVGKTIGEFLGVSY